MKRRELKKSINYLCGELMTECLATASTNKNVQPDDIRDVAGKVLEMNSEMILRLSHVEPGSTKLFFKKMREDIAARCAEIVAQINSLA